MTYLISVLVILAIAYYIMKSKSDDSFYHNITGDELKGMMKTDKPIIIDVRTISEVKKGMIQGAKHLELGASLNAKMAELDKSKKYVVYCRSGNRSAMACRSMVKQGYEDVSNLNGGYSSWNKNN